MLKASHQQVRLKMQLLKPEHVDLVILCSSDAGEVLWAHGHHAMVIPRPCDVPLGCPGVHGGVILEYLCSPGVPAILPPHQPEPPPHHGGGWSIQPPREGGEGGPGGGRGEEGEHTGGAHTVFSKSI